MNSRNLVKYGMVRGNIKAPFFKVTKIDGLHFSVFKENSKLDAFRENGIYSSKWVVLLATGKDFKYSGKVARELINAFYPDVDLKEREALVVREGEILAFEVKGMKAGQFIGVGGENIKPLKDCARPFGIRFVYCE